VEGYEPLFKMMERGRAGSANRRRLAKELVKVQKRVAKDHKKKTPVKVEVEDLERTITL
jgi:hypothetical protein